MFRIIFFNSINKRKTSGKCYKDKKRVFSKRNITTFKEQLSLLHWRLTDFNGTMNEIYDTFLEHLLTSMMLISPYAKTFLKKKISNPLRSAKV